MMATHFRAVVIGGGVVGCSVLYHLAKLGWRDVALIERAELTAGSTWHAAGGMHTLNGDTNVAGLQKYTMELYKELEAIDRTSCGVHRPGCIYLASTDVEVEFFKSERAKAQYLELDLDFIELSEAKRLNPLLEISFFQAAMFDRNDGHVDPSGVTNALAKGARDAGATIIRHCPVQAVRQRRGGEWELDTPNGVYTAEYVINAAGLWAREVGRLFGAELPVVPMEHQYLITNDIPELVELEREIPVGVDFRGAHYFRQERNGLLLGTYEQDCRHWALDGTPPDFGTELLPPDLDRMSDELAKVMERLPALREAGIKRIVNGGMVFSPDGNPIIGPLVGQPTAFVAAGCMAGFSQCGGIGLAVANWIVHGEPGLDAFAMDIARFGTFASKPYVLARTTETYRRRMIIPCPNEQLEAGRPLYTSPIFDSLAARGALFGQNAGWEVPLWFAGSRSVAKETPTFQRSNAFGPVGEECRAVRTAAGILDASSYCKFEISGTAAAAWLDGIVANEIPQVGAIAVCPMLTPTGRILGEITVFRMAEDLFLAIGSPAAETAYFRWLEQNLSSGISLRCVTQDYCAISLSGPRSRDILSALTSADVSSRSLPFFRLKSMVIGLSTVLVARLSFTGELGYELYFNPSCMRQIYDALRRVGDPLGLRDIGVRALNSLRLEKGYGSWGSEYSQNYTSVDAGIDRWVKLEKAEFIGRQAAVTQKASAVERHLTLLRIEANDIDPAGGETVFFDGAVVARLTSGAHTYTYHCGLGLAYIPKAVPQTAALEVEILGNRFPAFQLTEALFDPMSQRLRS